MTAWYNEPDPYAAQWLENLIAAGHVAPGIVDRRPIQEIEAYELVGFTQCHFFAGIGVWSHALRRAGWPDDQPIWTGSCPCQPFSNAGQQKGFSDDRHLWPYWEKLIGQCKPARIAGEQVASALDWLDLVSVDLEKAGYAFGASDLCAAGFGGAHIRQRLYFVGLADAGSEPCQRDTRNVFRTQAQIGGENRKIDGYSIERHSNGRPISRMANANGGQRARITNSVERFGVGEAIGRKQSNGSASDDCSIDGMEYSNGPGQYERSSSGEQPLCVVGDGTIQRPAIRDPGEIDQRWLDADWLLCRNPAGEPSWRPVEPGTFPLAHGVAARMVKLRAYGNALDAETATQFCGAVREIVGV